MSERVEELSKILRKRFGFDPSKVKFVFKDKSGLDNRSTKWYDVDNNEGMNRTISRANGIYGYDVQTTDGVIAYFWHDTSNNEYNLYGLTVGRTELRINPPLIYESDIMVDYPDAHSDES